MRKARLNITLYIFVIMTAAALLTAVGAGSAQQSSAADILNCQSAMKKELLKLLKLKTVAVRRCVDGLLKKRLLATGEDPLKEEQQFLKMVDGCDKAVEKIRKAVGKAKAGISKKCSDPDRVALSGSELRQTLGFDVLSADCDAEGFPLGGEDVLDDIIRCQEAEVERFASEAVSKLKPRACEMLDEAIARECADPVPSDKPPPKLATKTKGCLEPEAAAFYRDDVRPHVFFCEQQAGG